MSWQSTTLSEVVKLQRGHDLPEPQRVSGKIPVMGSSGLTGWHNQIKCKGPGVVVGRSGSSFGVVSWCEVDYWLLNTALYVTDFCGNDPKFIYYLLKTVDFSAYNSGSAQASLNRNFIANIPVKIPQLTKQKLIAVHLKSLEDKIELNNQINETLEQIAKGIFKEWFIDFGPVKANAEGKKPFGMDDETAALFSDSFEDSTLGPIPKDWRICELDSISEITYLQVSLF
jgi:type I restriction enzyme S subunit